MPKPRTRDSGALLSGRPEGRAAWLLVRVFVFASAGLLCLAFPSPAGAQHEAFVEALAEFTAALPGTYGDEGIPARAALDRMERGLAEWDRTLAEYEANVAGIRPTASASRLLDMHRTMGLFYLARVRLDDAIREFDAAVALEPAAPLFHLFRGLAHQAAGRKAEALKAYTVAFESDAGDPVAAYMVADASLRLSAPPPPAALASLSSVVDRIAAGQYTAEPDPFIGVSLVPDDLTETPRFVPWWYSEAYMHVERAEYAAAVEMMRAAVARDPLVNTPAGPALLRGSDALRAGRLADAIEHLTTAVHDAPGSASSRLLGVAYWLAADHERSLEHLEHAVRLSPMDERARLMLARVLEELGETARAEQVLLETVRVLPSSAAAHWRLGRIYASANRTEDAVREYEASADLGVLTGEAPLLLQIGELHRRELDPERAEAAFARAVALRPNDGVAHRERGRALLQLGKTDAAFVELAAALVLDRTDYESCLTIGQIHLDAGQYQEAARVLSHAITIEPERPEAYYTLATALTRSGRREEAAPHLDAFARLQRTKVEQQRQRIERSTWRLEAGVLAGMGELDRAASLWTRILADEPDVAANHAGLAAALAGLGQLDAAAAAYEKAVALDAGTLVQRQLAALYDRMGRPDAASRTRARLAQSQQDAFTGSAPSDSQ